MTFIREGLELSSEPDLLAAQLVGCSFAGYRWYQHRHRVNGIHFKRIIQRHNEKHQHGEVRGEATCSHLCRCARCHKDARTADEYMLPDGTVQCHPCGADTTAGFVVVSMLYDLSPADTCRLCAVQPIHGPNSAFVTKELDLEEMEHANFDPEVAAAYHEDGLEEADLGYGDAGDYGLGHHPNHEGAHAQQASVSSLAEEHKPDSLTQAHFCGPLGSSCFPQH